MKYILSVLAALFLSGCCGNRQIEQDLAAATSQLRNRSDSALYILANIIPDRILRRSTRARYALLYSQALDKNYIDTDDDSLMRVAYRYYEKRMCSDSVKFLINYYYGRIFQNGDDYQQAIRYYLTAEKYALTARRDYFLGLIYTRIGEVYSDQMNYPGMLEYYRKAYDAWRKLHDPKFGRSMILNIANAY